MTSTIEVRENTGHYGTATFVTCKRIQVFRNSCVKITDRLAQIRCATAAILKRINHTRSYGFGNFVFEEDETSVKS